MGSIARQTRTPRGKQINPIRLVEAGARRIASRAQTRTLLARFLTRDGHTIEQCVLSESGIGAREADLLWWAAQTPGAGIDDAQYPGN